MNFVNKRKREKNHGGTDELLYILFTIKLPPQIIFFKYHDHQISSLLLGGGVENELRYIKIPMPIFLQTF